MATIGKYQIASGTTLYRVCYRTPDDRQTDKRGFTTKRDAERFAATVEVSKLRGEYVAPRNARVTLGELGPGWLDRQRGHLSQSVTSGRPPCSSGSPNWVAARPMSSRSMPVW